LARDPQRGAEKFDADHYPAYRWGRAGVLLGTTPGFLRSLDEVKLLIPQRSPGGHRRYSRYQLRLAERVRALMDEGTGLEAACRIVILEDQLEEARRINAELHADRDRADTPPGALSLCDDPA
jgi:DNA-binding transcriptional MerR regulator